MTPHEILVKARELISDPARWTQDVWARDDSGKPCGTKDKCDRPRSCWCAYGAVSEVAVDGGVHTAMVALNRAASPSHNAIWLNDNGTHAEVLAMFTRAIEATRP